MNVAEATRGVLSILAKTVGAVGLLALGVIVGGILGGSVSTVSAMPHVEPACEDDHCGRIHVRLWFDRDGCVPNTHHTACNALGKDACEDVPCPGTGNDGDDGGTSGGGGGDDDEQ